MPKAEDGMEAQGGAPQGGQPQGQPQGDPMQQVMQMAQQMAQEGADPMQIVQALMQQGVPPEAIAQVLVQLGMPEEQVQQVMQQAMQQGQEGQPQGQPQQEGQPMMEGGGESGADSIMRYMADGGQAEQPQGGGDPMQQVMQMAQQMAQEGAEPAQIIQALMQQGVPPEAVAQILVQLGVPEDQVQQIMQQVMQQAQGQGGPPQEGAPQGQPQEGGQPMMAKGGETHRMPDGTIMPGKSHGVKRMANGGQSVSQEEQIQQLIMMYVQIQEGTSDEEKKQIAQQIMSQLQEANTEEKSKILDEMSNAVSDFQGGANSQPSGMPSQGEQMMAMLGGSIKDFNKIRKERLKEYKAGGVTDPDSIPKTSIKEHSIGLSDALKKIMYSGVVVNNMNKKYDNMATVFDDIPMAEGGYEMKDEELVKRGTTQEIWGTLSDEEKNVQLNKWIEDDSYKAGNKNEGRERTKVGAVGGEDNPTYKPDWKITGTGWNGQPVYTDLNASNNQGGMQRDAFGNPTNQQDNYHKGWNAYQQSYNPGGQNSKFNFDGFGAYAGMNWAQFTNSIANNTEIDNAVFEPIWKQNIFGKEKRHTRRNVAGYRFEVNGNNSNQQDGSNEGGNNEGGTLEDLLASHNRTMDDYNNNPEIKREIDSLLREENSLSTEELAEADRRGLKNANDYPDLTRKNLQDSGLTRRQAKNRMFDTDQSGSVSKYERREGRDLQRKTNKEDRVNKREENKQGRVQKRRNRRFGENYDINDFKEPINNSEVVSDNVSYATQPTSGDDFIETEDAEMKAKRDMLDNKEVVSNKANRQEVKESGSYEKQYSDKELKQLYGDDAKGLKKAMKKRVGEDRTTSQVYQSTDDKSSAATKASNLEGKPESEWTEEDWDLWESNYEYMDGGAVNYYANGGQHLGTPFRWDGKTKKFIPYAKDGYTTENLADDLMTTGNVGIGFLDNFQAFKDDQNAITNRQDPFITQPSGDEGVYGVNSMMPQGTGTDVMPGTGTDWEGFGKGQRTYKDSLITGVYRDGGIHKGSRGMNVGSNLTLNDNQIKLLEKAGYGIKLRN